MICSTESGRTACVPGPGTCGGGRGPSSRSRGRGTRPPGRRRRRLVRCVSFAYDWSDCSLLLFVVFPYYLFVNGSLFDYHHLSHVAGVPGLRVKMMIVGKLGQYGGSRYHLNMASIAKLT